MTDFFNAFLLVYAGLFPIINPIGNAPIFLGLTSSGTEAERNTLARRVAINSFLLLAGSMFVGSHLLVFFGITLPVVRVAGGLVLIAFGWKLLHSGAEVLRIYLERADEGVRLGVEDDGSGFDEEQPRRGFGLVTMKDRAEALGGKLRVDSRRGAGTKVELEL